METNLKRVKFCPECGDLIDHHFGMPDCQKCGALLPGAATHSDGRLDLISSKIGATVLAIGIGFVSMWILSIIAAIVGATNGLFSIIIIAAVFSIGISAYRYFRALGSDSKLPK